MLGGCFAPPYPLLRGVQLGWLSRFSGEQWGSRRAILSSALRLPALPVEEVLQVPAHPAPAGKAHGLVLVRRLDPALSEDPAALPRDDTSRRGFVPGLHAAPATSRVSRRQSREIACRAGAQLGSGETVLARETCRHRDPRQQSRRTLYVARCMVGRVCRTRPSFSADHPWWERRRRLCGSRLGWQRAKDRQTGSVHNALRLLGRM